MDRASERVKSSGIELIVALGFGFALFVLIGLPPVSQAASFWSGAIPTASAAVAMVVSVLWIGCAVAVAYATLSVAASGTDLVQAIRAEHRREMLLGTAGIGICVMSLLMSAHSVMVQPGSVHAALQLIRK